jgi:two-component system chemotaxis sensor kinase CheA
MDVVRNSINELHGIIELESEEGKGTKIRLQLPLTLATLDGMLVNLGKEKYIIPTLSILEIYKPSQEQLKSITAKGEIVYFRGEYIPIIRLHRIFEIPDAINEIQEGELLVVSNGGLKAALLVDSVQEQFQIVLKSLQQNFRRVDNISSATILGDGNVALIIDIQAVLQKYL